MDNIRILCLSGSLRKTSYNTALINALPLLASSQITIVTFSGMAQLPLFNPDKEEEDIPAVVDLRNQLSLADGLIIASPEYAHGISGVLKNALDWLVSTESFPNMPVALLNASPRATHAQIALREVIKTMSGIVIEEASISVPLLGSQLDTLGIVSHPEISKKLTNMITILEEKIVRHSKLKNV